MTYLTSITQLWRKHPTFFLLMLVMAVAVLPGVTQLPPMDRDEARYMQASHQMLDSGDVITIRFQDELRAKKTSRNILVTICISSGIWRRQTRILSSA